MPQSKSKRMFVPLDFYIKRLFRDKARAEGIAKGKTGGEKSKAMEMAKKIIEMTELSKKEMNNYGCIPHF